MSVRPVKIFLRSLIFAMITGLLVMGGFLLGTCLYPSIQEAKLKQFESYVEDRTIEKASEVCSKFIEEHNLVPEYQF